MIIISNQSYNDFLNIFIPWSAIKQSIHHERAHIMSRSLLYFVRNGIWSLFKCTVNFWDNFMFQHVLFKGGTYASILGTRSSLAPPGLYLVCFRRLGVGIIIIVLITSVLIEDLLHECLNKSIVMRKQIDKKLSMITKSKNDCLDAADW